jgi:hypothetical protein
VSPACDAGAPGAAAPGAGASPAAGRDREHELAARVIDTLLREDFGGLAAWVRLDGGGAVLDLPASAGVAAGADAAAGTGATGTRVPLERDGFLADWRARREPGGPPLTLDLVDALVAALGDPLDAEGAATFAAECRVALATLRLHDEWVPAARARLARLWRAAPDGWCGPLGLLRYEALAAAQPHPAYPTSPARLGFSEQDSRRYAPEFLPQFTLRWLAVPRGRLVVAGDHGDPPPGWPVPGQVGLADSLADTHELVPVHPVTAREAIGQALAEARLAARTASGTDSGPGGGAVGSKTAGQAAGATGGSRTTREAGVRASAFLAPGTGLWVAPTLSTRTVAVTGQPGTHLKLPLPTSTLGLRNRRLLPPGTLADGALVRDILATAAAADPGLSALLLADEGSYAHAGHPCLGYLRRLLPAGLEECRLVPVAALLAPGPDATGSGRPLVIEELSRWAGAGNALRLFDAYLRALFDVGVRLFARYGIALESHQQNCAVVLARPAARAPSRAAAPRLLVKDFDGALIHWPRLASALGAAAPGEAAFADRRLLTGSDDALADVFTTITVHLCAGALAFGLAGHGVAPLGDLLGLVRRNLAAALDRDAAWPATAVLRARVLDAGRLTGKSMVTAGTLVAKSRTGASDINKFYGTTGPNYLRPAAAVRSRA